MARIAFTGSGVFLVLLVAIWMPTDFHPRGVPRAFEVVFAICAVLAYAVGVLSLAVGALAFPSRGYWSPRDRPLPRWGRLARLVTRIGIRLYWVTLLCGLASFVPSALEYRVDALPHTGSYSGGLEALSFVLFVGFTLTVAAGVVWLVAETVGGYGERRRRGAVPPGNDRPDGGVSTRSTSGGHRRTPVGD